MNILFIGDIFGKTGRKMIATYLPKIVEKYSVECVIANGENTSHGKGLLQKHYDELLSYGISLITNDTIETTITVNIKCRNR